MLIGFIGPPASGKSTVAAGLYFKLKINEYLTDFITEKARRFIEKKRGDTGSKTVSLSDQEQVEIFGQQVIEENICLKATADQQIIITDGCIANTYLYMKNISDHPVVEDEIRKKVKRYNIIFNCIRSPSQFVEYDPGRMHSQSEANDIGARVQDMISTFGIDAVTLQGPPKERADEAFKYVLKYIQENNKDGNF